MDDKILMLESQIRECYGRVFYAHACHEKQIQKYRKCDTKIKIAQIIFSAIITGGIIGILFKENIFWLQLTTAIISGINLIAISILKNFSFAELSLSHSQIAAELIEIREDYLSLIVDLRIGKSSIEAFLERRDVIQSKLMAIYKRSPKNDHKSFLEAQKSIKDLKELTFTDTEIDKLLPKEFRRTNIKDSNDE